MIEAKLGSYSNPFELKLPNEEWSYQFYFGERTKNHLWPFYLSTRQNGKKEIRSMQGNCISDGYGHYGLVSSIIQGSSRKLDVQLLLLGMKELTVNETEPEHTLRKALSDILSKELMHVVMFDRELSFDASNTIQGIVNNSENTLESKKVGMGDTLVCKPKYDDIATNLYDIALGYNLLTPWRSAWD